MLQEEMERRERDLSLFHSLAEGSSDTLPLKICVTTAKGRKMYRVGSLKSKKDISRNLRSRLIHSILCEKPHLLPDSLNKHWRSILKKDHISTKSAVRVQMENFQGRTVSPSSHDGV